MTDVEPHVVVLPQNYSIFVVLPVGADWTQYEVDGRAARLITWLVQHRLPVEALKAGSIGFSVGSGRLQPEITERYPSVRGRWDQLGAWLMDHRPRIERVGVGRVTFNVGLRHVQPQITEHYPSQPDAVSGQASAETAADINDYPSGYGGSPATTAHSVDDSTGEGPSASERDG